MIQRKNTVYPIILVLISIATTTYLIPMATTNVGARYFAMMIMPFASVGPQILLYKTINLHIARPTTKRAAATALVNSIGGTSNIWMSYLYIGAPRYFPAFGTCKPCLDIVFHLIFLSLTLVDGQPRSDRLCRHLRWNDHFLPLVCSQREQEARLGRLRTVEVRQAGRRDRGDDRTGLEIRDVLKGSRSVRAFAKGRHCCRYYSNCFVYA
jgi:hypothetical protein